MPLVVRRAGTPGVVARSEVPADQWAVGQCSCVQYSEYEDAPMVENVVLPGCSGLSALTYSSLVDG
jgi:hypothetical protein